MGIAPRDKRDADVELLGQILLLRLVESSQQSPTAIIATDADPAVDVTSIGSKRVTVERHQIESIEHLRNDTRSVIDFVTERAQKPQYFAIGGSERRAESSANLETCSGKNSAERNPSFRSSSERLAMKFADCSRRIAG